MRLENPRPVRFPGLHALTYTFFRDLLALVCKRFGDPPQWPVGDSYDIQYHEFSPGQFHTRMIPIRMEYRAEGLYSIWGSSVSALGSFQAVTEQLREQDKCGEIENHLMAIPQWGFLVSLAKEYFARSSSCALDQNLFEQVYRLGEEFLVKKHVVGTLFIDLVGLKADINELELSPQHRIMKLDQPNAKRIWTLATSAETHLMSLVLPSSRSPILPGQVIIAASYLVESARLNEAPFVRSHEFRACALAFRLCEPGGGAIRAIAEEYEPLVPTDVRSWELRGLSTGHFSYFLDGSLAERLKEAWPTCYAFAHELETKEVNVPFPLRIAAKRFAGSFVKLGDEDRLIDFAIAMEALLGRENEAISYRIPLKASALLGTTPSERERVFDVLKVAYAIRSRLVHGSHSPGQSVTVRGTSLPWQDFLLEVQGYLIRCIRIFIKARERQMDKDSLLAIIEGAIVSQDRTDLENKVARN